MVLNTAIPVFEGFPLMLASDHGGTKDDFWVVDWKECDVPVKREVCCLTLVPENVTEEKTRIFILP
jgi:hypothetical protein